MAVLDGAGINGDGVAYKTTKSQLEKAKRILEILKKRNKTIKEKDNGGSTDLTVTAYVDNALKGVAIQIDSAKGLGFKSMKWLADDVTKEDKTLYSQINDNYINSFVGYSYPDLKISEGLNLPSSLTSVELDEKLRKVEPTFFISADPLVSSEEMKQVLALTDSAEMQEIKAIVERGFFDKALDVGVEQSEVNELLEEDDAYGFNSKLQAKLEETVYIPTEQSTSKSEASKSLQTAEGEEGGEHTGSTDSTYTGEFPPEIMKVLGSLQASKNASIGVGYPAPVRAIMDLISRTEGTHEAKGKKGYGEYLNYTAQGRAAMVRTLAGTHPHPQIYYNGPDGRSSAAGRYQYVFNTWKNVMGASTPMTASNQDKAIVKSLKQRGVYDFIVAGNFDKAYDKTARSGGVTRPTLAWEWASIPTGRNTSKALQGNTITGNQWIQAAKILTKFYEGASTVGANARNISEETNNVSINAYNTREEDKAALRKGAPKMLNTDGKKPTYKILGKFETDASKLNGKNVRVVKFLSGDIFWAKTLDTDKNVIIKISGVNAPGFPFIVQMEHGADNSISGMLTGLASFANKYDEEEITNSFALFGQESRDMAHTRYNGSVLKLSGVSNRTQKKFMLLAESVQDTGDGNVEIGNVLIGLGAMLPGNPPGKNQKNAMLMAKRANRGVWQYQAEAIIEDKHRIEFNKYTGPDGKVLSSIKKAVGMTPRVEKIVTNEQRMNSAQSAHSIADNAYTATSRPILAAKRAKLLTAQDPSPGRGGGYCYAGVKVILSGAGSTGVAEVKAWGRKVDSQIKPPYKPISGASAYHAHTQGELTRLGFTRIKINTKLQPGDVLVVNKNPLIKSKGRDHGHISIYDTEGVWHSDFKQASANIYRYIPDDKLEVVLYRDSDFITKTGAVVETKGSWDVISQLGPNSYSSVTVDGNVDTETYAAEAKRLGVYPDLTAYTVEQIEGHRYEKVDVVEPLSVYGLAAKNEFHLKKMLHNYEKGLNVCFPVVKAYAIVGNEDDDIYVEGVPLLTPNYYELPPLQSFNLETNNDFNPLDVCVFSCINPSGMRSAVDEHSDIGLMAEPELLGTQWFNPMITQRMRLLPGMKIHIRAGYSSDPNKLIPIFNGTIKETSGTRDFMIQCVCESYANELLAQQLGPAVPTDFSGDHNASTGLLIAYALLADNITHFGAKLGSHHVVGGAIKSVFKTPFSLAAWGLGLLASPFTGLFGSEERAVNQTEGITYMNTSSGTGSNFEGFQQWYKSNIFSGKGRLGDFRDPENKALIAPITAGNFLWNMFNLSRGNLSQRLYMNIYSATIEKNQGDFRDEWTSRYSAIVSFNRKFLYKFYVMRSTVWTVLKEMEYRHPGTLAKPLLFEERQTMFFGTKEQCYIARDLDPFFMLRAGMHSRFDGATKPYTDFYIKERKKRFDTATGFHMLSTKTNVISCNISLNREFATKINTVYYESKWVGGSEGYNEESETVILDKTLSKFDIKEKTISLGGCHGTYMAWVYGTQELKKEMESMYGGHIIVTGDPTIKAGDYAYISDTIRNISGTIKIRECSHHFSPETGYTTIIKPGLFVEPTHFMWDDYFLRLNLACTLMDNKLKMTQDTFLLGNSAVQNYLNALTMIQTARGANGRDYAMEFAGMAIVAGFSYAGYTAAAYYAKTVFGSAARVRAVGSFGWAYGKTAGQGIWSWGKALSKTAGNKIVESNAKIMAKVIAEGHAGSAKKITSLGTKTVNVIKSSWTRTVGARSMISRAVGFLWRSVVWLGKVVMANPVTSLAAVILGVVLSWATSRVRKMKLLHNAITFFPLSYNGKAYVAGITGWSGKGQWDAAFENFKKNAKIISRAGRMMDTMTQDSMHWANFVGSGMNLIGHFSSTEPSTTAWKELQKAKGNS